MNRPNCTSKTLLALLLLCLLATAAAAEKQFPRVTVTRVIDGDTIEVTLSGKKERVRMIGVDTPETVKPGSPVEPYGKEASEYTRPENHADGNRDHGNVLFYVTPCYKNATKLP